MKNKVVSIADYKNNSIIKGFLPDVSNIHYSNIEAALEKGFESKILTLDKFEKAMNELDILKGIDPTHGGKLVAKYSVDKNGKKTLKYVSKEDKDHTDIKVGDKFKDKEGNTHTVVKDEGFKQHTSSKGHHLIVVDEQGKKRGKYTHRLEPHCDEDESTKNTKITKDKENSTKSKISIPNFNGEKDATIKDSTRQAHIDFVEQIPSLKNHELKIHIEKYEDNRRRGGGSTSEKDFMLKNKLESLKNEHEKRFGHRIPKNK